jgi:hypothetical protein
MKSKIIIMIAFAVFVAGIGNLIYRPSEDVVEIVYLEGMWEKRYSSISNLASDDEVDLIIVGSIIGSEEYKEYALNGPGWFMQTNFTVQISSLLHGSIDSETIHVHQTGGHRDNVLLMFEEDPLMKKGDKCVLFLHEIDKGNYYVVGGSQGRFPIEHNKVYSLGEIVDNDAVSRMTENLKTKGMTIEQFITSLEH